MLGDIAPNGLQLDSLAYFKTGALWRGREGDHCRGTWLADGLLSFVRFLWLSCHHKQGLGDGGVIVPLLASPNYGNDSSSGRLLKRGKRFFARLDAGYLPGDPTSLFVERFEFGFKVAKSTTDLSHAVSSQGSLPFKIVLS